MASNHDLDIKKTGDENYQIGNRVIDKNGDLDLLPSAAKQLLDIQKLAYKLRSELDLIIRKINMLKLKKLQLKKEKEYLEKYCPSEIETTAWCVSYNENLSGITKTIEIDGVLERDVLTDQIRNDTGVWIPATQNQSEPDRNIDSILQHPLATSEHATWFNLAILPARQRENWRYRVGTIATKTSNNSCTVALDGHAVFDEFTKRLTTDKPIFPDQKTAAITCSFEYSPCNGRAFTVGDRVIVKNPGVVIGFYSNPKKCHMGKWSDVLGFGDDGTLDEIGIPTDIQAQGGFSRAFYTLDYSDTGDKRTFARVFTDDDLSRVANFVALVGNTRIDYVQSYHRSLSGHSNEVIYAGGDWTIEEEINLSESVGTTCNFGDCYSHSSSYTWTRNFTRIAGVITEIVTVNRSYSCSAKQFFVDDDTGSAVLTRSFTGSGEWTGELPEQRTGQATATGAYSELYGVDVRDGSFSGIVTGPHWIVPGQWNRPYDYPMFLQNSGYGGWTKISDTRYEIEFTV